MEIWKPIKGYESLYEVSDAGRVRSVARVKHGHLYKGKVLSPVRLNNGYYHVSLSNGKNSKRNILVHRIVAEAFVDNPLDKPQVNHINGKRDDNRASNLEWCTCSENIRHSFVSLGKKPNITHKPNKNRRLTDDQVRAILSDSRRLVDIAADYGMDHSTIADIKHRKIYADVSF